MDPATGPHAPGTGVLLVRNARSGSAVIRVDPEATFARLKACGRQCLDQDDADVLILGCGTLSFLYADRLQAELGGPQLSATVVFDHPTAEALAAHLAEKLAVTVATSSAPPRRRAATGEPIAVVGLSCRFPGGETPEAFWQLLHEGRDAVREISPDRWDIDAYYDPDPEAPGKMYVRRAGLHDAVRALPDPSRDGLGAVRVDRSRELGAAV